MENTPKPLVSVIIPCYNSTELQRTLESVCKQSYSYWEALCVDDGSDMELFPVILWDKTLKRHQDYDFVIRYSRKYKIFPMIIRGVFKVRIE